MNGGVCERGMGMMYTCTCADGYSGAICDLKGELDTALYTNNIFAITTYRLIDKTMVTWE